MRCLHETLYAFQWVRSPPDPDQLGNPFLNHPNRFNTAITQTRYKLVVVR
jgi:hypothetical protein